MKTNIFKKGLWVACAAFLLASCGNEDNPFGPYNPAPEPNGEMHRFLEESWFTLPGAFYHNGNLPAATTDTPAMDVTLSAAILVDGTAYANITVVTETRFRRFYLGVEGINEYYEVFPVERTANITSTSAVEKYNEATGKYTYIIPIQYSKDDNTDFAILLMGEDENCKIINLFSVEPGAPEPTIPPTPGVEPKPEDPTDPTTPPFNVEGDPEDLHVYLTFDQQKDLDLYLCTPGGHEIYWENLEGDVRAYAFGPKYHWKMDKDNYHECNMTDEMIEHIYVPKAIVCNGTYKVRVNLWKHCNAKDFLTHWSVWATFDKKPIKADNGITYTAEAPLKGEFAANCPEYPLGFIGYDNNHAVVMTFTINNPTYEGSGWSRGKNGKSAADMQQELLNEWAASEAAPKAKQDWQIVKKMECQE